MSHALIKILKNKNIQIFTAVDSSIDDTEKARLDFVKALKFCASIYP